MMFLYFMLRNILLQHHFPLLLLVSKAAADSPLCPPLTVFDLRSGSPNLAAALPFPPPTNRKAPAPSARGPSPPGPPQAAPPVYPSGMSVSACSMRYMEAIEP
mmetsp:Transcript_39207/g.61253  ORF Transcript_39207/g.61253 Transcript_39207/m.61253 type:complete len:103 (-) Transcript_39207:446-754(-)